MIFKKSWFVIFLFAVQFIKGQDKPEVNIGGALRFNYNYSSWKEGQKQRGGDFGYDLFRINAKAKYKDIKLDAEYRFYSEDFGGMMLKQGWLGYEFDPENEVRIGLVQVPFGITPYNSTSWFFSMNYYIGLEDDYDMGLKYSHRGEKWHYDLAFFKNSEELRFGSNSDLSPDRFSYDVGSIAGENGNPILRNKEVNQFNGRVIYQLQDERASHEIGLSGQFGGLYNLDTEETGSHYALAIHYQLNIGGFNLKAEASKYSYDAKNPKGEPDHQISMIAYGASYLVASQATSYTIGAAYTWPVKWGPVSGVTLYNDFGLLDKNDSDFEDSYMNVTGLLITSGNVYTYVDYALGKNQPWLGSEWTNALAIGVKDADWESRFNINIGYYF